jgi:integrase
MSNMKAVILKGEHHIKDNGTCNIKIRITHSRKADYISTDLYVLPDSFDSKAGVVKTGKNKEYINLRITDYIQKYQRKDIELGDRREFMTVKQIKASLLEDKNKSGTLDFFEFAEEFLKSVNSAGTLRWHNTAIVSLNLFVGHQLPFSEINLAFLKRYENHLRRQGVGNGINNYMRSFRALFNKARDLYNDEDAKIVRIPQYPFRNYTIPSAVSKSKNHFLSIEELCKLINHKCSNLGEEFAVDMFLLMIFLIGIEAKDLFYLSKPNKKGRVLYNRFKTGKEFSIKLEPEALAIINKYPSKTYLINVQERYSNHLTFIGFINDQLHGKKSRKVMGIFPKLKIAKNVTTKWARHTWATIARNECRINKDDVALCLGHEDSDNKVTDMYIKYDYSIIDESNRKVIDYIKLNCSSVDMPLDNK